MTKDELNRSRAISSVFKALGHPSRMYIVEKLRDHEFCVCELSEQIGVDTSTISRHLSILKRAGVVKDRKTGTTVYYTLACNCLGGMLSGAENIIRKQMESQSAALTHVDVR